MNDASMPVPNNHQDDLAERDRATMERAMNAYVASHGVEAMSKVLCNALVCLLYAQEAQCAEYTSEVGRVRIACTPIPARAKS